MIPLSTPPECGQATPELLQKIRALQTQLVERGFILDCQGRADAGELAMTTAARLGELCAEWETAIGTQRE